MLNNRGQSLILFVMVIPILLLILVLVVDVGRVMVLKHELDNINEIVLDYGLDNMDNSDLNNVDLENELINLIKLNKNDIDMIDIDIEDDKIYIVINDKVDGVISSVIDISLFDVESSYVGYMDDNNERIERVNR